MKKWLRMVGVVAVLTAAALAIMAAPASSAGNTQISGIAYPDFEGVCTEGLPADFVLLLTGDLEGCWYGTVTDGKFNPSGTYQESGTETFIGCLGEVCGTFDTTYFFRGKYVDDSFAEEIFGFCQHTIVAGTGTEGFEGVKGRVHFKDDVELVNFPYTGHLKDYAG